MQKYSWRNVSELSLYGNATFQYVFYGIRPKLQNTMSVIVAQQWVKKNIICLIIEQNLKNLMYVLKFLDFVVSMCYTIQPEWCLNKSCRR